MILQLLEASLGSRRSIQFDCLSVLKFLPGNDMMTADFHSSSEAFCISIHGPGLRFSYLI